MSPRLPFAIVASVLFATAALAQTPYGGMQTRPIKALSDQQVADLKAGRGMGLALAAELNGYPGPSHLLELADRIGLTEVQQSKVKAMFEAMKAETIPIGERLLAQEAALDRLFADHKATPDTLTAATAQIGDTQAKLREAHLKYHLATVAVLDQSQIRRYDELRGYAGGVQEHHHH
jgi:LTXXQ motif family protein